MKDSIIGAGTKALVLVAAFLLLPGSGRASGQQENPIYVDLSPRAWTLFQLAREQASENEGEAVRLYQELLDLHAEQLIPRGDRMRDEFVSARRRVLEDLRSNDALLQRYRLMQSAEAQRMIESGDILALARTRSLTEAGLDAVLRTAQESLESARFRGAVTWLDEAIRHPDLRGRRAAHCWFMLGLASHYLDHPDHHAQLDRPDRDSRSNHGERVREAVEVLTDMGADGRKCLAELDRLRAAGGGPTVDRGLSPLDHTTATDLTDLVGQTIWSLPLDQSLLNRRFGDPLGDRPPPTSGYDRALRRGDLATIAATVAGNVVYVNEGHTVRALDRFTGRAVWDAPYKDRADQTILDRDTEDAGDMSVVAVEGGSVVTLTGHAKAASRSSDGRVVCLDAGTGERRWAVSFDRINGDREYEGLYPHGAPIITEGRVYVLARKVTGQMLTGCYVVALDLAGGEFLWIRHIASSGSKIRNARPYSSLVHRDGVLYVATPVGAIAALDALTGNIRWLHRYSVPVNISGRQRQPWEMSGPVLTGDRLIALTPDRRRIVMFEERTGSELESVDARSVTGWNSPAYLVASGDRVYAIGNQIRAFHADDLEHPIWRLPAPSQSDAERRPALTGGPGRFNADARPEAITLVGRVQSVDDALVVPTAKGLLLVDGNTGRVLHDLEVAASGNPLALGAQLILAGADGLDVFMSLRRAEQMLRDRIATSSDDPEPAMSLLQLGLRVGNLDMALEGAEQALIAIERLPRRRGPADLRQELFTMLLEIHRRRIASTAEEAEAMYALIGRVAATTEQRVEFLLAHGDGLAERAPDQSVEIYQSVLSEPAYAALVRGEAGTLSPAARWATSRLHRLIEENGLDVYEPQADYATRALAQLLASRPIDPTALSGLSLEFPFSDAAVDAALEAARIRRERGDDLAALRALSEAYRAWPTKQRIRRLVGPFIEICEDSGHVEAARGVLARIVNAAGDATLDSSTGSRRAERWLADIAPALPEDRKPRIGLSVRQADVLGARLLPRIRGARVDVEPDRALLLDRAQLRLVTSESLDPAWTAPVSEADVELALFDRDELILWFGGTTADPRIVAMDPATGRQRWTSQPLGDLIDEPWNQARGVMSQMPDGLPFDPVATLPLVGEDAFFLVRRSGGVVALDRMKGETIWAVDKTLEQVHLAIPHAFGLVLVGLGREINVGGGGGDLVPRIQVLDPRSGKVLHRLRPQGGVFWTVADPFGSLVCASSKGIELFDLLSGRRRWTSTAIDALESQRGWLANDRVIVEGRSNALFAIRLDGGSLTPEFDGVVRGNWDSDSLRDLHVWDDLIFARYRDRIIRYDLDGNVLGADIVNDSREYRLLLHGEESILAVSQHDSRQKQMNGEVGRRTVRTYRVYVFSQNCRLESDPIELLPTTNRIMSGELIDGWLLLSSTEETLALPLPVE